MFIFQVNSAARPASGRQAARPYGYLNMDRLEAKFTSLIYSTNELANYSAQTAATAEKEANAARAILSSAKKNFKDNMGLSQSQIISCVREQTRKQGLADGSPSEQMLQRLFKESMDAYQRPANGFRG